MSNKPNFNANKSGTAITAPKPWWQSPAALIIALIAAAVAIALLIGALVSGDDDGDSPDVAGETGFAEIIGDRLPELSEPDAAVGMTMPIIEATDLAGGHGLACAVQIAHRYEVDRLGRPPDRARVDTGHQV